MRLLDDHSRALLTAGLVKPIDVVFGGFLAVESFTVFNWWAFGQPTAEQLVVVLLATMLLCQMWTAFVVFRLGVIILKMRGDINLMPAMAAQLVQAARLGGAPSLKKS